MKKNTIRIVGFLFAAACVALLASCKNSTSPAKKDDGKKPTPAAPAFDKAKLKGSTWRYDAGSDIYLFNFDNSSELRVAHGVSFTESAIKTRAEKVPCKVTGDNLNSGKIEITFGDVKIDSPFSLASDNVLTITNFKGTTVNLKKVTKEADVTIVKKIKFYEDGTPENVVAAFNTLWNVKAFGGSDERTKVWQVKKIEGADVSAKKLYIYFSSDDKVTLAVDAAPNSQAKANAESAYTSGVNKFFGYPSLTITDLITTDAKLEVKGAAGSRTAVITLPANKSFELAESTVNVNAFSDTTKTPAQIAALFVK